MINKLKSFLYSNIVRPIRYRIFDYKCPICMNGFNKYLSFGYTIKRDNAQCPKCKSLERDRMVWLFLKQKTTFFQNPPSKALHIAPEHALKNKFKNILGNNYLTADLFRNDVDLKMDVADIQFPDKSFDFIYCSHVLEHVPDDKKAMAELHRILTDNGYAIILVPTFGTKTLEDLSISDPQERKRLYGQEDHVRSYGIDFVDRLKDSGFKVDIIPPQSFLNEIQINQMAVNKASGILFFCRR